MKILFVEDTDIFIERFGKQLKELGEVAHFKSSNAARREMGREAEDFKFDLVVCDHNILRFEEEYKPAQGTEIYYHLRYNNERDDIPFIHFSADPCSEKYDAKDDKNFYMMRKDYSADLVGLIKEVMGLEDE